MWIEKIGVVLNGKRLLLITFLIECEGNKIFWKFDFSDFCF